MNTSNKNADLVLHNGRIATLDGPRSFAQAVAIQNGRFIGVGSDEEIISLQGTKTEIIDVGGRTVIPGLNDSHTHPIRGGLNYNMELRWDGVPSLADALRMLKEQAQRTPPPQWVRVVGGWTEFQFAERRMPTLDEINRAAPDTPVFVLHLYDRAILNRAALRAVGYTKETPEPPGGEIQRDRQGNPTGLLIAKPNANILYSTLTKGPRLSREDQLNSTRLFMRELNRFGVTSAIDAGAGTDGTRVSSYNPWVSLYWLVTGKTVGGLSLYQQNNRLDRTEALRLWTIGSSWFSPENGQKGAIIPGQLADLAVLSADYFSVPEEQIKNIESVLTIVGGNVVYAKSPFEKLAPPSLPVSPSWSPVGQYGGYYNFGTTARHAHATSMAAIRRESSIWRMPPLWSLSCECWAFQRIPNRCLFGLQSRSVRDPLERETR